MREEKILVGMLRGVAELVAQEAERNPEFAQRLDVILAHVLAIKAKRKSPKLDPKQLPDVFAELKNRGEAEFELWLRGLDIPVLRALIKHHELDPSKRSQKWNDAEKLAHLMCVQLRARLNRGVSFLKPGEAFY